MNTLESLVRTFVEGHPQDAAKALEQIDAAEAVKIVDKLPFRIAGLLMERLTPLKAGAVFALLEPSRTQEFLTGMSPRQASLVLHHLESGKREEALAGLPDQRARELRELMNYPPETAGGMMEPRVASIPMDLSVQAAISVLRKAPRQSLFYLYVTDRDGKLIGVLNMRNLLLASPRDTIESLMSREIMSVPATMSREEVFTLMRRHRFLALPVVDAEGRLIGVIKHDEALRAGQLEAFEDLQKMVGAGGDERALSPVSTVVSGVFHGFMLIW
jgi:magnesium transporter